MGIEDYPRGFVADEYSSTLPGFENMGLALDHFSMIKFGSNEDYHYILVVNELVKMADKARGIMRKRGEALSAFPFIALTKNSSANILTLYP